MPITVEERRRIIAGVVPVALVVTCLVIGRVPDEPIPRHTGQPGAEYLEELFNNRNDRRFYDVLRMDKDAFMKLDRLLQANGLSNRYRYRYRNRVEVSSLEKTAILIHVLKGSSNRILMERFQHSPDTRSKIIDDILNIFMRCGNLFLAPWSTETPETIRNSGLLGPFFISFVNL